MARKLMFTPLLLFANKKKKKRRRVKFCVKP